MAFRSAIMTTLCHSRLLLALQSRRRHRTPPLYPSQPRRRRCRPCRSPAGPPVCIPNAQCPSYHWPPPTKAAFRTTRHVAQSGLMPGMVRRFCFLPPNPSYAAVRWFIFFRVVLERRTVEVARPFPPPVSAAIVICRRWAPTGGFFYSNGLLPTTKVVSVCLSQTKRWLWLHGVQPDGRGCWPMPAGVSSTHHSPTVQRRLGECKVGCISVPH